MRRNKFAGLSGRSCGAASGVYGKLAPLMALLEQGCCGIETIRCVGIWRRVGFGARARRNDAFFLAAHARVVMITKPALAIMTLRRSVILDTNFCEWKKA